MAAKFKSNGENNVNLDFSDEPEHNFYRKPTEKELASCRPVRIFLIVLFALVLLGLLVGSVVLIIITEKCTEQTTKVMFSTHSTDLSYLIDVKSFADSDNDTFGDLRGVQSKLDYIKSLSINTIVLTGIRSQKNFLLDESLQSPNDLKNLVKTVKENKMFLLVSFSPMVVTTDSDWFKNETLKYDWFIWRNSTNNWLAKDGNSAWFKENGSSSYYSYFGRELPMLNFRNSGVMNKFKESITKWLDYGIDGFVFEGVSRMTVNETHIKNVNATHEILRDIYKLVESKNKILWLLPDTSDNPESYFGTKADQQQADYILSDTMATITSPLNTDELTKAFSEFVANTPLYGKSSWLAGGSMYQRLASRFSKEKASILNLLLLMLPGKSVLYYGDEISLKDSNGMSSSIMYFGSKTAFPNGTWTDVNDNTNDVIGFKNVTEVRQKLQKKLRKEFNITSTGSAMRLDYGDDVTVLVNLADSSVIINPQTSGLREGKVMFNVNSQKPINVGSNFVLESPTSLNPFQFTIISKD